MLTSPTTKARRRACAASLGALVAALIGGSAAAQPAPETVEQRVNDAASLYESVGFAAFCTAVSDPNGAFLVDEAYVFAMLQDGRLVCHPRPDLLEIPTGAPSAVPEMLRNAAIAAPEGAWTEYPWPRPDTREVGLKSTYCRHSGALVICAGAYFGGAVS